MNKQQNEALQKMNELVRFGSFLFKKDIQHTNVRQLFNTMEVDLEMDEEWTLKDLSNFQMLITSGLMHLSNVLYRYNSGNIQMNVPLTWNSKTMTLSVAPTRKAGDCFEISNIEMDAYGEEYIESGHLALILYKAIELLQILPKGVLKSCKQKGCRGNIIFISTNSKREFCSDQCRINYNVQKARERDKKKQI